MAYLSSAPQQGRGECKFISACDHYPSDALFSKNQNDNTVQSAVWQYLHIQGQRSGSSQPSQLKTDVKGLCYIKSLKSYRIKASRQKSLPCWGLIIHHPELQLERCVIMVPPYGSDCLGAGPLHSAPGWRQKLVVSPVSISICVDGLCMTCSCWTRAVGSHLVTPCSDITHKVTLVAL